MNYEQNEAGSCGGKMGVVGEEFDKLRMFLNKPKGNKNAYVDKAYEHCVKADGLRIQNYFFESIEEYQNAVNLNSNNAEARK